MVADRGEARPHPHAVGVAARLFRGGLDGIDAPLQRLRGEVGVQYDVVEHAAPERERLRPECHQRQANVLIEVRVEEQDRVLAHRPVVVEDHLAAPQPAHDLRPVFHLRGCDGGYAERAVDRGDAAADAQREAPAGEPVHGRRP